MRQVKPISLILICWLIVSHTGIAVGQDQGLKRQYKEALDHAQAKQYEQAYDRVLKVVREDEFYYEAQLLRIALATILKKTASENPRKLIQNMKEFAYAPIGSDIERDVRGVIDQLSGTPSTQPKGESAMLTKKETAVSPYIRERFALVVGIGAFEDTKINPLKFTSNDARVLADTLSRDCNFNHVKVLIDRDATRKKLLIEMENIANAAQPDDLVVIYIASHGSPEDMDRVGVNYIITHDSEVDNLFASSYEMKQLLEYLVTRIRAQRVVAILDTCFSGATFKETPSNWSAHGRGLRMESSGLQTEIIQKRLQNSGRDMKLAAPVSKDARRQQDIGRVVIASSRQNQKAWEGDSIKHGYFTYYLIQALKRRGPISIQTLYDYLSSEVPKAVRAERNAEQNPTMVSSVNGSVNIYIKD